MRWQIKSLGAIRVACIAIYIFVLMQLFMKNLVVDTDYPFHMHNIWAASKGFLVNSPYLSGGSHVVLKYGAPTVLLGAAIYPVLERYTVAVLLAATVPFIWYLARNVFKHFTDPGTAEIAALGAILNPFTLYYLLTSKLPFIWGLVFALASIYFYLERKSYLTVLFGVVAVITHPLIMFLFGALFLLDFNDKRWLKLYLLPIAVTLVQLTAFFGLFSAVSGGGSSILYPLHSFLLAMALAFVFWLNEKSRPYSGLALIFLTVWYLGGISGLWIPTIYFDRIAFLVFLMLTPALVRRVMTTTFKSRYVFIAAVLIIFSVGGVWAGSINTVRDNASAYLDLPENIGAELKGRHVHYASDGSALYELPRLENVTFSNAGRESYAPPPENVEVYVDMIEHENCSYILVYETSPEENVIHELGYPIIYSRDNVKIYKVLSSRL